MGRAPQLALLAGRRLPVDEVLGSGVLVLGGDMTVAESVLGSYALTPKRAGASRISRS